MAHLIPLVLGICYLACFCAGDASEDLIREGDKEFISAHYEKAIDLYTKALDADSSNYRAYYKRASVYTQTKKYRQALFDLNQVLNHNSDYHLAVQSRAKVHQELGNWDSALEDLKKLKHMKPDFAAKADALINEVASLKTLISQGDTSYQGSNWQDAKNFYGRVLELASGINQIRLKRAHCSYNLGAYSEVVDDTMRILKVDKSNVEAITIRGHAFRQLGEVDAALMHYKSCIKFSSIASGDCKVALQELEQFQAQRNTARGHSSNPSTAKAALELVENSLLGFINRHKLEVFREDLLLTKCRALVQLNEAVKALEACESVGGAEAHKLKGEAYIILEKFEEAVREYQKAVDSGDQGAHGGLQNAQRLLKMSKRKDYYKILDVPKTANSKEIKRAYHKMALKWHPDKNPDNRAQAEEKLKDINEANTVLSDPEKRGRFDRGDDVEDRPGGGGHGFGGFEGFQGFQQGFQFHFGGRRG